MLDRVYEGLDMPPKGGSISTVVKTKYTNRMPDIERFDDASPVTVENMGKIVRSLILLWTSRSRQRQSPLAGEQLAMGQPHRMFDEVKHRSIDVREIIRTCQDDTVRFEHRIDDRRRVIINRLI